MAAIRSDAFQAVLEGRKTARESLAKNRHQKPHSTPLFRWQVGKPIEMAAQVIDAVVQGTFGVGLEDDRDILRLSSRQSALHHPAFLVGRSVARVWRNMNTASGVCRVR